MRLIVTTMLDCYVYDTQSRVQKRVERIERQTPQPREAFGVTWTQSRLYIGWRRPCEVLEYDRALSPTGRACRPWKGHEFEGGAHECTLHQLLHLDGVLLVANTGRDEVSAFRLDTLKQVKAWKPHECAGVGKKPKHLHYNTMYAAAGKMFIVAHMHGTKDSEAWEFERGEALSQVRFVARHACGNAAHNVFPLAGQLLVLDSNRSRIVKLSEPNRILFQGPRGTLLRGVARGGDGLVVGCSALQPDRELRRWVHGDLLAWEDGDLSREPVVHEMGGGPISDVRCLDRPDAAHWPNRPFAG